MTDGILLLDKPSGPTSNRVLNTVRRWAGTRKVGHLGTLDPLATGLLPTLVGRATRLAPFLPSEPKVYTARLRFGVTTDTADAQGKVITEADSGSAAPANWNEIVAAHRGELELPVPAYAAVKVKGRPLYKYARAKQDVELPVRSVRVSALEADVSAWPVVSIRVECSTGTYIRALAESLGRACGCGAHVVELRRTRIADWDVGAAVAPDALQAGVVPAPGWIPLDQALTLKALSLPEAQVGRIGVGRPPECVETREDLALHPGERFVFTDREGHLLAVATSRSDWSGTATPPEFDFERVLVSH